MTIERPMFPPVDPTRRHFLTVVAAGATALTLAPARATTPAADPIYAAIEQHKAAGAIWDAAVTVRADLPEGPEPMTAEQCDHRWLLDDAIDDAWKPCEQAGVDLINNQPTTLAGIVAAIGYIRVQMRDDGTFMPHHLVLDTGGDAQETMGWIDAFLDTIADAVAALDRLEGEEA